MSFSCPLCHQPLSREKNSYICPQRHQFDMAKEGYVNLLPVQHKRSRDPGDSAEMIQARRAFLDAGHYQPLRDAIVAQLRERLDEKATAVLDIGCGEGYYTHAFADVLPEITTFGLDVSKVAIKAAAKRYPQVTLCVASSHRLPFSDTSMDAIIRIYAPCKAEELARVVKPGGWVITATPGPRHLMELKGLIYNEVHLHAPHAEQLEGFTLQQSDELCYPMRLRGDEAVALLQMTPFAPGVRSQKSGKHWQQKKCSTARRTLIFTSGSVLINRGSASRGSGRRCRSAPARREFPLFPNN